MGFGVALTMLCIQMIGGKPVQLFSQARIDKLLLVAQFNKNQTSYKIYNQRNMGR